MTTGVNKTRADFLKQQREQFKDGMFKAAQKVNEVVQENETFLNKGIHSNLQNLEKIPFGGDSRERLVTNQTIIDDLTNSNRTKKTQIEQITMQMHAEQKELGSAKEEMKKLEKKLEDLRKPTNDIRDMCLMAATVGGLDLLGHISGATTSTTASLSNQGSNVTSSVTVGSPMQDSFPYKSFVESMLPPGMK